MSCFPAAEVFPFNPTVCEAVGISRNSLLILITDSSLWGNSRRSFGWFLSTGRCDVRIDRVFVHLRRFAGSKVLEFTAELKQVTGP